MRDNGKALQQFDVAYFAASVDPVEKNKEFAESLKLDFPILSDPGAETAMAYGIYNPEREIANRVTFYIGTEGKILAVDTEVTTDSHGADVVKKLEELEIPRLEKAD